jgi:hypothetical protein
MLEVQKELNSNFMSALIQAVDYQIIFNLQSHTNCQMLMRMNINQ